MDQVLQAARGRGKGGWGGGEGGWRGRWDWVPVVELTLAKQPVQADFDLDSTHRLPSPRLQPHPCLQALLRHTRGIAAWGV